jgi:hypothetical protein
MNVDWGLTVLVLCVTVPVLIVAGLYFHADHNEAGTERPRFLGSQMDRVILIVLILLLLLLLVWLRRMFVA